MYFDIKEETVRDLDKIDQILELTKETGLILAIDSNARSAAWHDTQTNKRVKTMEEYITSKSLHIMNKESERTMFHNRRGSSNIDLTIVNDHLLKALKSWEIYEEESCSDHSIIKFYIGQHSPQDRQHYNYGIRYIDNGQNLNRFDKNLIKSVAARFQKENVKYLLSLDNETATQAKETRDIEEAVDKLQEAITLACNNSFKTSKTITERTTINQHHGGPRNSQ